MEDLIPGSSYEIMSWSVDWIGYICICCLLWGVWMDKCLAIKFELVWMDKFIRWPLVSGLNGFMSCESIQTSWFQVWFTFDEE